MKICSKKGIHGFVKARVASILEATSEDIVENSL